MHSVILWTRRELHAKQQNAEGDSKGHSQSSQQGGRHECARSHVRAQGSKEVHACVNKRWLFISASLEGNQHECPHGQLLSPLPPAATDLISDLGIPDAGLISGATSFYARLRNRWGYQVHVSTHGQPNPRLPHRAPGTPDRGREARLGPPGNICKGSRARARRGRGGRRVPARARPRNFSSSPRPLPQERCIPSPPSPGALMPCGGPGLGG